jgi:glycosyltransferase involved in cell wall biosynthesis
MSAAVCAIIRDEARDIAEWIAFQFAVGFDAVCIYDNGSVDGTADIVRAFAKHYDVRLRDWPTTAPDAQQEAYEDCLAATAGLFDWLAFIDADELIIPRQGDVRDLLERHSAAPAIMINWAIFGTSGHATRPPGLMAETFRYRATYDHPSCRIVKQIVRSSTVVGLVYKCIAEVRGDMIRPSGVVVTRDNLRIPEHSVAQLNHYWTKSRAEWDARRQRGYRDPATVTRRTTNDFASVDRNEIEDNGALRFLPRVREILAQVGVASMDQSDPALAELRSAVDAFGEVATAPHKATAAEWNNAATGLAAAAERVQCSDAAAVDVLIRQSDRIAEYRHTALARVQMAGTP